MLTTVPRAKSNFCPTGMQLHICFGNVSHNKGLTATKLNAHKASFLSSLIHNVSGEGMVTLLRAGHATAISNGSTGQSTGYMTAWK